MIFLSLKTYKQATGDNVIRLLSSVKKISKESGIKIIPVAQPTDIYRIKKELDIEVWGQHIDPIDPGRHMGWISAYSIKQAGASGVIINHSEHKLSSETVEQTVFKAKEYDLKTLVIGHNPQMVLDYDKLNTDFIGYEKEDNIETEISMIETERENIKKLVNVIKHPFIIGAGISTGKDVEDAVKLGAKGVILASAFVKAKNPEEKLKELVNGFKIF